MSRKHAEGESSQPSADADALEALNRRLDVLAWNLPRPRSELYLPPEQVWPDPAAPSGEDGSLLPPAA